MKKAKQQQSNDAGSVKPAAQVKIADDDDDHDDMIFEDTLVHADDNMEYNAAAKAAATQSVDAVAASNNAAPTVVDDDDDDDDDDGDVSSNGGPKIVDDDDDDTDAADIKSRKILHVSKSASKVKKQQKKTASSGATRHGKYSVKGLEISRKRTSFILNENNADAGVAPKKQKVLGKVLVHRLAMNNVYEIHGIKRIVFNNDKTICAVARMNSEIELWSTATKTWTPIGRIPSRLNTTIESIVWVSSATTTSNDADNSQGKLKNKAIEEERLFTAGLHGTITEWDLATFTPKNTSSVYGGAIWCMAYDHNTRRFATACEDGKVRLFDLDLGLKNTIAVNIEKQKTSESAAHKTSYRLLSITFSTDGKRVLVGGTKNIYSVNVLTNRITFTIDTPSSVWSLLYLKSGTLVAGDSNGNTFFCDGSGGIIEHTFKQHVADVLQLTANDDESIVYSIGVHPRLARFVIEKSGRVIVTQKDFRLDNDCHAMAFCNDTLYCGGIDGRIFLGSENGSGFSIIGIAPINGMARFNKKYRLLLCDTNNNSLRLMHVPEVSTSSDMEEYNAMARTIVSIPAESDGGWGITTFDMSDKYIAYSCLDSVYLMQYEASSNGEEAKITKTIDLQKQFNIMPGFHMSFATVQQQEQKKKKFNKRLLKKMAKETKEPTSKEQEQQEAAKAEEQQAATATTDYLIIVSRENVIQIINLDTMQLENSVQILSDDDMIKSSTHANTETLFKNRIHCLSTQRNALIVGTTTAIYAFNLQEAKDINGSKPLWIHSTMRKNGEFAIPVGVHWTSTGKEFYLQLSNAQLCLFNMDFAKLTASIEEKKLSLSQLRSVNFVLPLYSGNASFIAANADECKKFQVKTTQVEPVHYTQAHSYNVHNHYLLSLLGVAEKEYIFLYVNWVELMQHLPMTCKFTRFMK